MITHHSTKEKDEKSGTVGVHLFAIRPRSTEGITDLRSAVQHLVTWDLPDRQHSNVSAEYTMHAASGTLYQATAHEIITYHLTELQPRRLSAITVRDTPIKSLVRLSSARVLAASGSSFGLYDTKWSSLHALQTIEAAEVTSKKRKRTEAECANGISVTFVGFFQNIETAVCLSNNQLIGLRIHKMGNIRKKGFTGGMLADAVGQGLDVRQDGSFNLISS
ncbi:hypothetical protein LTS18_002245, partial [Coniosporium uncinatum]